MADHTPRYFGTPWGVPALDGAIKIAAPVGEICYGCGEPIAEDDRGWIRHHLADDGAGGLAVAPGTMPIHAECELRPVLGHHVGICSCTGYDTSRTTARLVWDAVMRLRE
jgi:hypothetical protein